jgi:crotonobetainyl-CoA:carnitine CoA-transferase CaiB-like acyl-CoA transferase
MAERFLRAYDLGHLLDDPRFTTNEARVRHASELDALVTAAVAARPLAENLRLIDEHELTAVAVQTVAEIERDPHWQARGLLVDVPQDEGAVRMHAAVPRLSDTPGAIRHAGGALGQHNAEVYRDELGLSCDEIRRLGDAGVL